MNILLFLILFASTILQNDYPESAVDVAETFATLYEKGDSCVVNYVFYDGKHVNDIGSSPEEMENKLLPNELKKKRKNPSDIHVVSKRFEPDNQVYGCPVWFIEYSSQNKIHIICLHKINDKWKVDLSYLWFGDWCDFMPGY